MFVQFILPSQGALGKAWNKPQMIVIGIIQDARVSFEVAAPILR
jgi:hypothetical protein